jgi:uncharacterized protein
MILKSILWLCIGVAILYASLCLLVYFFQEKIIFHPEQLPQDYVFDTKYPYEELFFEVRNQSNINALHFRTENSKGCVLYIHGNAGSLASWHQATEFLIESGYDVLIYDFAEYGKSTGKLSSKQLYTEAETMYDYLKKHYEESKLIIYGRSLGTGIASRLATKTSPVALVLETPYHSLGALGQRFYPFLPIKQLLKYKLDNAKNLKSVQVPTIILHGTSDEVVPYDSGKRLKEYLKPQDEFVTIEGGFHSNLESFEQFHNRLKSFLARNGS